MEITAENMRFLSNDGDKETLTWVLSKIEIEARKHKSKLFLSDYKIDGDVKTQLEERGFRVEIGGRMNEVNTVIMW
jgi:hypothetical protein